MTEQYQTLRDLLLQRVGADLSLFRPSFLERRLSKRIMITNCSDIEAYIALFTRDDAEINALLNELTINVSWFFRNPLTWELLRSEILPDLINNRAKPQSEVFRIWSAGCARGEEPYTMAILMLELMEKLGDELKIQIIATDSDTTAIVKAQKGLYDAEAVKNVPYGILTKYFEQTGSHFQIRPFVKKLVHFSQYDLLDKQHSTPPEAVFGDFDIVICQNVLIYYIKEAGIQIFDKIASATSQSGYLLMGPSEQPFKSLGFEFRQVFKQAKIYKKISSDRNIS